MQVFCPKCAAANEVAEGTAGASCTQCGTALPVNMPAFGPPEMGARPQAFGVEDMAAAGTVQAPPPPAFTWDEAQAPDGAWVVGVKKPGPGCALAFGLLFFFTAFFAAEACGSTKRGAGPPAFFGTLFAVYFAYKALCAAVNRGTLRLDGTWLSVQRGPVPELGGVRVETSRIAGFDVFKDLTVKSRDERRTYYVVRAIGLDAPARLPLGILPREQADFIAKRLGEMLADVQQRFGIAPPPMPGSPGF